MLINGNGKAKKKQKQPSVDGSEMEKWRTKRVERRRTK
tara:strand:+ start:680 stop:793 length:114 start_codon:yes stop_codon:yes gene_type:complete